MNVQNKRAQLSLTALILFVVMIIAFNNLLPILNDSISEAAPNLDPQTGALEGLFPLFLFIGIVISLFTYAQPQYQQNP